MRISGADQPELIRIHPKLRFHLETVLERGTRILELQHLRLLHFREVEVALVPTLEVRELVVRRKERMRFAVAFDLRDFVERLPTHAILCICAIDLLAGERLDDREHAAVAQITVVRDGEDLARRFFPRTSPSISTGRADWDCRAAVAWCKARSGSPSGHHRER